MIKQFISVGQIINTHGINGELKIYPLTDDTKRFRKLNTVLIDGIEKKIVWCKLQNDKVILKIEGIDSIEEAMKYREKYLEVRREDAVKLPKDGYFIADIIGCMIEDTEGTQYGKISDVIQSKSNDVYWVKQPKELLVPGLKEIVVNIDLENEKVIIKPVNTWQ